MDNPEVTLSAHEVHQAALKLHRFMLVFQNMEKILKVLADYENMSKALKAEAEVSQRFAEQSRTELDALDNKVIKAKETYNALVKSVNLAVKEHEAEIARRESEAKEKADEALRVAQRAIASAKAERDSLLPEIEALTNTKRGLEKAIVELKKEAEKKFAEMQAVYAKGFAK